MSGKRRGALIYVLASLAFICTDSLAKALLTDVKKLLRLSHIG